MKTACRDEITAFLDGLLSINSIPSDSSNNGLQVEGKDKVGRIFFGVDACMELFRRAADAGADFVFVHHGMSWGDDLKRITGLNARRLSCLSRKGISLYAAHLPLDCHPVLSHNAIIAKRLGLRLQRPFAKFAGARIGVKGEFGRKIAPWRLAEMLDNLLGGKSLVFGNGSREIRKAAIIAGSAGANSIAEAARQGLDCFITGEINHSAFHVVKETGITVVASGHYATEKPGVLAVMGRVSRRFAVKCVFEDIPTGL